MAAATAMRPSLGPPGDPLAGLLPAPVAGKDAGGPRNGIPRSA